MVKKGRSQEARIGLPPGGAMISLATRFSMPTLMSVQVTGVDQVAPDVGTCVVVQAPVPPDSTIWLGFAGLNAAPPTQRYPLLWAGASQGMSVEVTWVLFHMGPVHVAPAL